MNKYVEYANKTETSLECLGQRSKELFTKLHDKIGVNLNTKEDYTQSLLDLILYLGIYPKEIIPDIIETLHEEKISIPDITMSLISNSLHADIVGKDKARVIMNCSMGMLNIAHGIVRISSLKEFNCYSMTTTHFKEIRFFSSFNNEKDILMHTKRCHEMTQKVLLENPNDPIKGTTSIVDDFFYDLPRYHSFIEAEDRIIDISQNIVMMKDDYFNLFKPKKISSFTRDELLTYSQVLRKKDQDYRSCPYASILKCALTKRMEHNTK